MSRGVEILHQITLGMNPFGIDLENDEIFGGTGGWVVNNVSMPKCMKNIKILQAFQSIHANQQQNQ